MLSLIYFFGMAFTQNNLNRVFAGTSGLKPLVVAIAVNPTQKHGVITRPESMWQGCSFGSAIRCNKKKPVANRFKPLHETYIVFQCVNGHLFVARQFMISFDAEM